jgi:RNA polymerase-binding protein DksA
MDPRQTAAYRSLLAEMRQRLIAEVQATEEGIREDIAPPGEHGVSTIHPGDYAAEGLHENLAIAQNEEHLLEEVEAALARIEAGTFGTCQDCGRKIAQQRLEAIPYAALCIDCARKHEAESRAPR